MKYAGMPWGMWMLFTPSFRKQLTEVFGYGADRAKTVTKKAKPTYKEIIAGLPEFEKGDRFKMNLVNCAMIGAFIRSMPERPDVERLTVYYANAMMTKPMKWFCRRSGKSKFTQKDIAGMKATAALNAADRNPYSWNMEFYEYPDGSGYEGRFTKCGICVLMKELGLYDLTPALCHLDYTMGEAWLIPGDIPPGKRKNGGCKRQTPRKGFLGFGGTKRNKLSTSSLTTDRELISFHCQFAVSLVTILSTDSRRYESVYLFCSAFAFAFCVHLWFGFFVFLF